MVTRFRASLMASCVAALVGGAAAGDAPAPAPPELGAPASLEYAGLHNVVAYHENFWSGSAPEGDEGFAALAAMGVRTIISVDGAEPEVEKARALGMRYVHLPIGYNGFDEARRLELARAVRDLGGDGPVYIHCHHGKHRSAGAAAAIAVSLGWMDNAQAQALMKVSGTAPDYTGLYACAANAAPLTTEAIDAAPAQFPEVSRPTDFVHAMVEIDDVADHLKAIENAGWAAPRDQPDLVPVAEAGRLADLFRLLAAGGGAGKHPGEVVAALRAQHERAQRIEDLLAKGEPDRKVLSEQFSRINASCKDCHAHNRD